MLSAAVKNLDNVILNDKIPSLPDYVFNGCVSLTEISLPQTLSSVGQYALAGTGIVQAVLPQNVETVGDSAFEGCENLISATLGQKVRVLGASAFQNCISLSEITLNDGIEEIGNLAFANCSSLFVVKIPQSVVKVGKYAFLQNGQGLKILCVADSEPEGFDEEWNFGGYEVVWDCENQVENADFDFNLSTDEKYYILKGFASGKQAAELQLPSSHNGKPVKEIAAQAFIVERPPCLRPYPPNFFSKMGRRGSFFPLPPSCLFWVFSRLKRRVQKLQSHFRFASRRRKRWVKARSEKTGLG